jgi:hypothetical protein
MRRLSIRPLAAPVAATLTAIALVPGPVAAADPDVLVYPGMEIQQDTNICTLGYVDPVLRVAFTAGHCRGSGPVTDGNGNLIGNMSVYRDNTPNGATVRTDEVIADYEAIVLVDDVAVSDVLPGGRPLESQPGRVAQQGEPVCHFGIITGESCGNVARMNNGWFTMANGVVSQKGDSGGPVYVIDGGSAVVVGLFNSTWGDYPAAVSWQAAGDQIRDDVGVITTASGTAHQLMGVH